MEVVVCPSSFENQHMETYSYQAANTYIENCSKLSKYLIYSFKPRINMHESKMNACNHVYLYIICIFYWLHALIYHEMHSVITCKYSNANRSISLANHVFPDNPKSRNIPKSLPNSLKSWRTQ